MYPRVLVDLRTHTPPLVEVWLADHTAPVPGDAQTPLDAAYVQQGVVDGALLFGAYLGANPEPLAADGIWPLVLVWPPGQRYQLQPDAPQRLVLQVDGIRGQRIRGIAPHATLRAIEARPGGSGMEGRFELTTDADEIALYWRYTV